MDLQWIVSSIKNGPEDDNEGFLLFFLSWGLYWRMWGLSATILFPLLIWTPLSKIVDPNTATIVLIFISWYCGAIAMKVNPKYTIKKNY